MKDCNKNRFNGKSTKIYAIIYLAIFLVVGCHNISINDEFTRKRDLYDDRPDPSLFGSIRIENSLEGIDAIHSLIHNLTIELASNHGPILNLSADYFDKGAYLEISKSFFYDTPESTEMFYIGTDSGPNVNNWAKEIRAEDIDWYKDTTYRKDHSMRAVIDNIDTGNSYTQPLQIEGSLPTQVDGLVFEVEILDGINGTIANKTSTTMPVVMPTVAPGTYELIYRLTIPARGYFGEWNGYGSIELQ